MPNPKVGIALGQGAARGIANLGVLQILKEENIPIDFVSGTSAGAVVGSLYAAGVDLHFLERMLEQLDWLDLTSLTITRRGLISPDKIHSMLTMLTKDQNFEDLSIPVAVIATDLITGEEIIIDKGSIADGVRASMSIPGVFVPVKSANRLLVDGALVNPVPADVCRKMGADFVIAVDVGLGPLRSRIRNLPEVIIQTIDILTRQVASNRRSVADITLKPDLGEITLTELNRSSEIIEKGREIALANLDKIKKALDEHTSS